MPNEKTTGSNGYSALDSDEERDMAAKGGPTTSLGNPNDKHAVSHPYNADTQTQIAAKASENENDNNK